MQTPPFYLRREFHVQDTKMRNRAQEAVRETRLATDGANCTRKIAFNGMSRRPYFDLMYSTIRGGA
jgi:hypothetical protein